MIAYSGERHLATKIGPWQPLVGFGLTRNYDRVAVPREGHGRQLRNTPEHTSYQNLVPVTFFVRRQDRITCVAGGFQMSTSPPPTIRKPRGRWLQFSLRAMLVDQKLNQ